MKTAAKQYKELNELLQEVVVQLQTENISIDDAIKAYEKGIGLIQQLEEYLQHAKLKIIEINTEYETKKLSA
ncbi:MAG: hypothetical protein NVSMB46_09980 [Candidatus Saccharimonadales bacterium]